LQHTTPMFIFRNFDYVVIRYHSVYDEVVVEVFEFKNAFLNYMISIDIIDQINNIGHANLHEPIGYEGFT